MLLPSSPTSLKKVADGQDLPLSLPLITQVGGVMMSLIMATYAYILCSDGTFECIWMEKFPYVSAVMCMPPQEKLYSIMMTFWAWQKQASVRAYYSKFSELGTSPILQAVMLVAQAVSCIAGPALSYFHGEYHMKFTQSFVIGEVLYVLGAIYIVNGSRSSFPSGTVQTRIDQLIYCRYFVLLMGVMQFFDLPSVFHVYVEWVAFNLTFVIFILLSTVMPYTLKVQRAD